jgi:DNA-binding transcriptional ArsR family regulator
MEATQPSLDAMHSYACDAAEFLKAISHEGRLMILCHLTTGEKSVSEQAAVSQQLSRLRLEGLVSPRREGKAIYYSLTDERAMRILTVVYDMFCRKA